MKNISTAVKTNPRFIDDTRIQVTREFQKNARIYGTPEYRMWREIKNDVPEAVMVLKTIQKKASKNVSTRNMTYENMKAYIRTSNNSNEKMKEFETQLAMSRVQTNPYRHVLAWFLQEYEDYDSYKKFFEKKNEKPESENESTKEYVNQAPVMSH